MKFDIPDNWLVYLSALDLMRDEKKIATTTTAPATTQGKGVGQKVHFLIFFLPIMYKPIKVTASTITQNLH